MIYAVSLTTCSLFNQYPPLFSQGMLLSRILAKGLDPTPLTPYINSFTHACPPHAGGGVGLDRVVYLYLGLDNVRKATLFPRDPNRLHP